MLPTTTITYRHTVVGRLLEFLEEWNLNTGEFQKATLDLIDRLNNYEEEGEVLRPHVCLLDDRDFDTCNQQVAMSRAMVFWQGKAFDGMYEWAIKKFAPLCREHWKLFISVGEQSRIGLFGSSSAVSGFDDLEMFANIRGLAIRSISENVIEINPGQGKKLEINFNLARESQKPIFSNIDLFIDAIVAEVPDGEKIRLIRRVVERTVHEAVYEQHGFLSAVVQSPEKYEELNLKDVLSLPDPVDMAGLTKKFCEDQSVENYFRMASMRPLVRGMLMSDGITFFSACGKVLGFNGFVAVGDKKATGGARKRAFLSLSEMVDRGDLIGAFIQSQDGNSQWKIRQKDALCN